MQYLSLDVRQTDCPLTQTTRDHEVRFTTPYWHFDSRSGRWELRVHAAAADRHELGAALRALKNADSMDRFDLYSKSSKSAFVRMTFSETTAIGTIDHHGGYVVGPFRNAGGIERWHLGFDTVTAADAALAELDDRESYTVHDRRRVDTPSGQNVPTEFGWYENFFRLTDREREVLGTALEHGYYETPRTITLAELGEELSVSDVAVSKTLRRVERKLLSAAVDRTDGGDWSL